jgi:hypothetical protein
VSFYSNASVETPPFIGLPPVLPPAGGPSVLYPGEAPTVPQMQAIPTPYIEGPYCFGIDNSICANLPETIQIGPNFANAQIPIREVCKALTNTTCAIVVVLFLVVILGVALHGLLNNA